MSEGNGKIQPVDQRRLVRGLPQRVVKSRKPSPVAKSGVPSTFREDVTIEQHAEDLRKFITANVAGLAPMPGQDVESTLNNQSK